MRAAAQAPVSAPNAAKKARTVSKVLKKAPIEALLALSSGLSTFEIGIDRFKSQFDEDPLDIPEDSDILRSLDLSQVPCVVFFADREGSQMLDCALVALSPFTYTDMQCWSVSQVVKPSLTTFCQISI